jgi:DNA-binding NarL/FixJ family response regulator
MNVLCPMYPTALLASTSGATQPPALANLLLIEHDGDCAEALHTLLVNLPGVHTVRVAATTQGACVEVAHGPAPDVIFVDACGGASNLATTLRALRVAAPRAALVVLSVYPDAELPVVTRLADATLSKDTSHTQLVALFERLRATRGA